MIVFELNCGQGHCFEAWFRNSATFEQQAAGGEVSCPHCGDTHVTKAPMAPHLVRHSWAENNDPSVALAVAVRQALTELRKTVEKNADYVGDHFANEALKIHYGEAAKRNIYGEATQDEAKDLIEEGVDFSTVPWPRRTDS
ncbi:MAG: DUF1178 family protein [Alphaproteobacteria bacterium]|nr:DUF1178 family protein [Alphaproteobacteria bacterium]